MFISNGDKSIDLPDIYNLAGGTEWSIRDLTLLTKNQVIRLELM